MALPDIIPPDQVAGKQWGIYRSDDAGVIQLPTGRFQHAETGTWYSSDIYEQDLNRIKLAPLRLYRISTAPRPDSRWFENIAAVVSLDDEFPEIAVNWTGDIKPFSENLRNETGARVWDQASGILTASDWAWTRAEEFSGTHDLELETYRQEIRVIYNRADASILAAASATDLGRAEATFDQEIADTPAIDPNPWNR